MTATSSAEAPPSPALFDRSAAPDEMRVGKDTNPQALASAIAHAIYDNRTVCLRAIGAGAVNQGLKAVIIASGFTAPRGVHLAVIPGFTDAQGEEGGTVSGVVMRIIQLR